MILLFGLFAGAGQSLALGHAQTVPCSEASITLGSTAADIPGCDKGMNQQTCAADSGCAFLVLKNVSSVLERFERTKPLPFAIANLVGASTPPDTPPPILLS